MGSVAEPHHVYYSCRSRSRTALRLRLRIRLRPKVAAPAPQHCLWVPKKAEFYLDFKNVNLPKKQNASKKRLFKKPLFLVNDQTKHVVLE
jgi:hypothetical protein